MLGTFVMRRILWVCGTISCVIRDWWYACEAEKRCRLHMRDGTFTTVEKVFLLMISFPFMCVPISVPTDSEPIPNPT